MALPIARRLAVACWAIGVGGALLPASAGAHGAGHDAPRAPGGEAAQRAAAALPDYDAAAVARLVPERLPDLEATVTHESRQLGSDGVLRTTRYEERLVRRGDRLWTERVLPTGTPAGEHESAGGRRGGHQHLDLARAARHLQRDGNRIAVEFVDARRKLVVTVPEPDWDNVAFDGSWDRAAMLVTPGEIGRLRPLQRPAPGPGQTWLGVEARGRFTRVLWDATLGVARRIESGSNDGNLRRTVVLTPSGSSGPTPAPWQQAAAFERKGYSDLLD